MALESATYISDLVSTNPTSSDNLSQGDDHLRLLKSTIKATFPNVTGAVTADHTELNKLDGLTVTTADLNKLSSTGNPQFATIELGAASDTTLSRVSAGLIAVEGKPVVMTTGGQTIEHALGAVGTPSITATGDLNTGFWFPAADTIAASTGGTERWRVDSSGFVGVGTTSPGSNPGLLSIQRAQTASAANLTSLVDSTSGSVLTTQAFNDGVAGTGFRHLYNGAFWSVGTGTPGAATERFRIDSSGNALITSSGGLGYGTGSGGTVTQLTSKSTGVTLNKTNGQITMNAAALSNGASVAFNLTNSTISNTDLLLTNCSSNSGYTVTCTSCTVGSANIRVTNISGGSLSEAVVINFAVIKAVTS